MAIKARYAFSREQKMFGANHFCQTLQPMVRDKNLTGTNPTEPRDVWFSTSMDSNEMNGLANNRTSPCMLPLVIRVALILSMVASGIAAEPPSLTTSGDGTLQLRGKRFRGIGVNYYDAFVRSLSSTPARSIDPAFHALATNGIPFARFAACGYWPVDWALYQTNRSEYFTRLASVVNIAEKHRIGLIPSLFWHQATISDLVDEPLDQWGNPSSLTIDFMRRYTREVVTRFKDSPAIWAWEFGNEFNLPADLPNAAQHRPPVHPSLGTASSRSKRDELTHDMIRIALTEFAKEVRRHDPQRLILSGNAFPRPTAWHQKHEKRWGRDSAPQWREMLLADNPSPIESLSGRLYSTNDLASLPWAVDATRTAKKPLFIGEFGVPGALTAESLAQFRQWLEAIETHQVPLAALWVYDFDGQSADWNVSSDNSRAPLLRLIAERNAAWRAAKSDASGSK